MIFWWCQCPLKSLDVANPRITDLWTSAFLLFPDTIYLLTSSWPPITSCPLPHLFFHILALYIRPQDSNSPAWLLARRYLPDSLTHLHLSALLPAPTDYIHNFQWRLMFLDSVSKMTWTTFWQMPSFTFPPVLFTSFSSPASGPCV